MQSCDRASLDAEPGDRKQAIAWLEKGVEAGRSPPDTTRPGVGDSPGRGRSGSPAQKVSLSPTSMVSSKNSFTGRHATSTPMCPVSPMRMEAPAPSE